MISNVRLPGVTPPSLNAIAGRSNRFAFSRAKRRWQTDLALEMMAMALPRNLLRVEASAVLSFTTARRRDEGNFRVLLEKALGDALVEGGWLEDDTPDHYRFGAVDFAKADAPETWLILDSQIRRRDGAKTAGSNLPGGNGLSLAQQPQMGRSRPADDGEQDREPRLVDAPQTAGHGVVEGHGGPHGD